MFCPMTTSISGDRRVNQLASDLKEKPIIREIILRLSQELDPGLSYHCLNHTLDVINEVVLFAFIGGLSSRDIELLAIAAAYHDAGFLFRRKGNEKLGAELARAAMERFSDYSAAEINLVSQMILDTQLIATESGLKQSPRTPLSPYLLDADLSNLGRRDFFEKSELQLRELGTERGPFLVNTLGLLKSHSWLTEVAQKLRQSQKDYNLERLQGMVETAGEEESERKIEIDRLQFLARLSLLINSSLDTRKVIQVSLEYTKKILGAEAGTVFLKSKKSNELVFWALQGGADSRLKGARMPADKGIVGWVIQHQKPLLVNDPANDPRFYGVVDKEGAFKTKNVMCAPLTVRGSARIGAIQLLNKTDTDSFSDDDLYFLEQFANQIALSIDNAQLHQEVVRRNQQLERLGARKADTVRVLSHELKTPLTIIRSSAEILSNKEQVDPNIAHRMNEALNRGVERITGIANQLHNLTLIGQDGFQPNMERFKVAEAFERISEQYEAVCERRSIRLLTTLSEPELECIGDQALILVVLRNLVWNAIRFTPDEGSIELRAVKSHGLISLSVKDSGIGISEDQQELVFEKFYEVIDSMNHSSGDFQFMSGGLGLGLATVKTILEMHDSSIHLTSAPNEGSEFLFYLPAQEEN